MIAAGSIVDGRAVAAALALGAQGVWIGTRFIATHEARAAAVYKPAILDAGSSDTVVTRCYSGKTMRVIDNDYVRSWRGRDDEIENFIEQSRLSAEADLLNLSTSDYESLDPNRSCLPAGQGCGGIDDIVSAADVVRGVVDATRETVERV